MAEADFLGAAQHAWPEVEVPPDVVMSRLRAHHGDAPDLESIYLADFHLACACALGQPKALALFDQQFLSQVGRFVAHMRPSAAQVDELRQMLRERLLVSAEGGRPRIAEYSGRGSLASWLRVAAVRMAIDLSRQKGQASYELDEERDEPGGHRDPELSYVRERYRALFEEAFRKSVALLNAEQRNLLRMHFLDGLTLDQLASFFEVNRTTITRRIVAAREAILDEVRRRVGEHLSLNAADVQSLLAAVRSHLDLSLPSFLK
jgi:RNA polymerase sigma-70 factor, ECF subfamily